jgi:mono/diheme cytochrome c family protein
MPAQATLQIRQDQSTNNANAMRRASMYASASILLGALSLLRAFAQTAVPQDHAKIEAGESVYNNYCQACHGDHLISSGQTFDLRRLTAKDRERFDSSVRNGKKQMPPWKGVLTDEEIDQVWYYIRDNAYQK